MDFHTNGGEFEVELLTNIQNTKQMKKVRQLLTLANIKCAGKNNFNIVQEFAKSK